MLLKFIWTRIGQVIWLRKDISIFETPWSSEMISIFLLNIRYLTPNASIQMTASKLSLDDLRIDFAKIQSSMATLIFLL